MCVGRWCEWDVRCGWVCLYDLERGCLGTRTTLGGLPLPQTLTTVTSQRVHSTMNFCMRLYTRMLDTLDLKLQVATNYKSTNLLRAVEQLESRARHSPHILPIVQLEADPGPTATSTSLPGACCTPPHSPAIPSHSSPRRSQMAAPDGQVVENELSPPRRPAALETFEIRRNWNT